MTPEDLAKLTPEEKRIRIAELCGPWRFKESKDYVVIYEGDNTRLRYFRNAAAHDTRERLNIAGVPDYLNDLNAIEHEMPSLTHKQHLSFISHLAGVPWHAAWTMEQIFKVTHATAAQRADAFLLCLSPDVSTPHGSGVSNPESA